MVETIINIAKDVVTLERSCLLSLSEEIGSKDRGAGDYRRDIAQALLASARLRNCIQALLAADSEKEIDHLLNDLAREEHLHSPPVYLLGQALKTKIS